jgi:histidinol dehydrogenase
MSTSVLRKMTWSTMSRDDKTSLLQRGLQEIFDPALRSGVLGIIDDVRANGDDAVCRALREFDGIDLEPDQLRVSDEEFAAARSQVDPSVIAAIDVMIVNIARFNEQVMTRKGQDWSFESSPGLTLGEKVTPIPSVSLFCPSGKASYPSVLAQLGTPAVIAGVPSITVITPPIPGSNGAVDPATLVVADRLGLRNVFRVNGPAGVAAAAFGTERIPVAVKVVGPGSPAVTCAQVEIQRFGCTTMMLLGPTESMIIADDSADPVRLAADLMIEAEHI